MALVFALTKLTPNRVGYLITAGGGTTLSPDVGLLPNFAAGTTPNLAVDTNTWLGQPINKLVLTPVVTQADARALLQGRGLVSVASEVVPRGHIMLTPLDSVGTPRWSCDCNEGAAAGNAQSAGFAVITVAGPNNQNSACYLDLVAEHTLTR